MQYLHTCHQPSWIEPLPHTTQQKLNLTYPLLPLPHCRRSELYPPALLPSFILYVELCIRETRYNLTILQSIPLKKRDFRHPKCREQIFDGFLGDFPFVTQTKTYAQSQGKGYICIFFVYMFVCVLSSLCVVFIVFSTHRAVQALPFLVTKSIPHGARVSSLM